MTARFRAIHGQKDRSVVQHKTAAVIAELLQTVQRSEIVALGWRRRTAGSNQMGANHRRFWISVRHHVVAPAAPSPTQADSRLALQRPGERVAIDQGHPRADTFRLICQKEQLPCARAEQWFSHNTRARPPRSVGSSWWRQSWPWCVMRFPGNLLR